MTQTSLIFLAGGKGTRFGSPTPKQYISLQGKPIALHSFELFVSLAEIHEIIVVCETEAQGYFSSTSKPLRFASPGNLRQDSVYSGLLQTSPSSTFILTHDAARPFVSKEAILDLLEAVKRTGAASLANPVVNTIKQANAQKQIEKTLDRSCLWEMQTPQALKRSLFFEGFAQLHRQSLQVTDDVALAELLSHPVEVVPSSPRNFKITTPFDLTVANALCATN